MGDILLPDILLLLLLSLTLFNQEIAFLRLQMNVHMHFGSRQKAKFTDAFEHDLTVFYSWTFGSSL